jgi:WD40 repeat protein
MQDPLARLTFATTITSHDINQLTRSHTRLDVAIAFTTSDIIWFEAISSRYTRLNKSGCVNDSPITNIRWVPGSETLLLTSHSDGTCTIFDISREDSASGTWTPVHGMTMRDENGRPDTNEWATRKPFVKSWDPASGILVTRPAAQDAASEGATKKVWSKMNPVAHWRVARSSSITDIAFSPDHTKLAVVSTDGLLRIINLLTETLEGSFESYYGALNKVVFSPDAKFILTAGCDDLVSVWTSDGRLLSRCPGHSSFVRGLAFDPWKWKVEDKTYRFASVGEDGKVFLWDFSSAALVRPKATPHSASYQRRSSQGGSTFSLLQDQRRSSGPRRASMAGGEGEVGAIYSMALPRAEVAELQPVASFQIGGTALNDQLQSNITASASVIGSQNVSAPTATSAATNSTLSSPSNASAAAATAAMNEPGSTNDLLVDVRFRPDGLMVMHKSGAMRFFQRPRHRSNSRFPALEGISTRSRRGVLR